MAPPGEEARAAAAKRRTIRPGSRIGCFQAGRNWAVLPALGTVKFEGNGSLHDFTATCTLESFEPLIGETFELRAGDEVMDLRLDSVKPSSVGMIRDIPVILDGEELPPRTAFSVVFKGPADRGFEQGVFEIAHPVTGAMTLMLTCFGADPDARLYEAVFA